MKGAIQQCSLVLLTAYLCAVAMLHQYRVVTYSCGSPEIDEASFVLKNHPKTSQYSSLGNNDHHDNECSIYLAPSSVSDSNNRPAGFGVFTTKPLPRGSYAFPRGTGPTVPITDASSNNDKEPTWTSTIFMPPCVGFDIESADPSSSSKGGTCLKSNNNIGSLTNFHPTLLNVLPDETDVYRDNTLDRYTDPGAGAFSAHLGETWFTTRNVEAGEELFNNYSERWFFDGQLGDEGRKIPHRRHYLRAAKEIMTFVDGQNDASRLGQKDLGDFLESLSSKVNDQRVQRLISLVPSDAKEFVKMIESAKRSAIAAAGSPTYTFGYDDYPSSEEEMQLTVALGRRTVLSGRTVDWIRKHGRCLDNIYPGPSSLSQAGQGAFAFRRLEGGDVIAPIPSMIQVTDGSTLNVYRHGHFTDEGRKRLRSAGDEPYTQQLLVNYCYGHEKSSLLLCPATNANLINHCSTRSNKKEEVGQCNPSMGPNAILRWSTDFDPETEEWLQQTVEEIDRRVGLGRRGLSFEVVATREIGEGEEIFIDYGEQWEMAWAKHVDTWSPPPCDGYVPVSDMNADVDAYIRTKGELSRNTSYTHQYPNVRIGCFFQGFHHPCEVLERLAMTEVNTIDRNHLERRRPVYKVRLRKWSGSGTKHEYGYQWHGKEKSLEVPLSGSNIRFFAGPYSSDQHLPGTFRHHIGVPEGMWPKHWMNLGSKGVS